jgi:glycosyltransferase involved in cell wall biosynthesis
MPPLVSIIIPCFNASKTLPFALASCIAQTYASWECLCIDDGSTDHPEKIIETFDDNRIKCLREDVNRGRAFARQRALEFAQGEYMCMLDADDWMYPERIQKQLQFLESNRDIVYVSSAMALVDKNNRVIGVRDCGKFAGSVAVVGPVKKFHCPDVSFPASMIRMSAAKPHSFDVSMRYSEDFDFFMRMIPHRKYALSADVLYVYSEGTSITISKMIKQYYFGIFALVKWQDKLALRYWYELSRMILKCLFILVLTAVGCGRIIVERRHKRRALEKELTDFSRALEQVRIIMTQIFPA